MFSSKNSKEEVEEIICDKEKPIFLSGSETKIKSWLYSKVRLEYSIYILGSHSSPKTRKSTLESSGFYPHLIGKAQEKEGNENNRALFPAIFHTSFQFPR
ncbi:hypothetical protein CDAR_369361 [Caerostris darwini]|uniref:Ycf15 n=1 Tax=Caerostris darwini TaxID=1538125 RepID=A0AAV4S282_9ARAC|nr:hypothetical protein CDAR_369361 [Caerostris darwini]